MNFLQNPQEQLERVLRFVGVSHHWTFKVRPSNKHIVFDDPDLKELEEAMAQAYEDPNKNLYRYGYNPVQFHPWTVSGVLLCSNQCTGLIC